MRAIRRSRVIHFQQCTMPYLAALTPSGWDIQHVDEDAGYIEIRKSFVDKRPRTSARLTSVGRAAFDQHVVALQEIVARAGASVLRNSPR
jgi:Winged helix DNA-binding domain